VVCLLYVDHRQGASAGNFTLIIMDKKLQMLLPALAILGLASAWIVYGADVPDLLGYKTWGALVIGIVDFLFIIGVCLAVVMIVIAGFYFVNSNSGIDPDAVKKGKDLIKYALWGIVAMAISEALVRFFFLVLATGKTN